MEKTKTASGRLIYTQIPKVIGEVAAVGKNHRNEQQNYKFRSIDDVYNAINKALAKHEITIAPRYSILENEVKTTAKEDKYGKRETLTRQVVILGQYDVSATDGSTVVVTTIGEANDTSDKAFNKAMTAAYKYFMFQTFVIPTEEEKDTEARIQELIARKKQTMTPDVFTAGEQSMLLMLVDGKTNEQILEMAQKKYDIPAEMQEKILNLSISNE
jgi:hypothetical protein